MLLTDPHPAPAAALTYHGGRADAAARLYPDAPAPWLDLSTGINPFAWDGADAAYRVSGTGRSGRFNEDAAWIADHGSIDNGSIGYAQVQLNDPGIGELVAAWGDGAVFSEAATARFTAGAWTYLHGGGR